MPITKLKVRCIVPSHTPQVVSFNLFLSSHSFLSSRMHIHMYFIPKLVITWIVQVAPFPSHFNSQAASWYPSSSAHMFHFLFLFLSQKDYFLWALTLFQSPNTKLGITHRLMMNGREVIPTAFRTKGCEIQWIFLTGSRMVSMVVSLLWQLVATEALLFCGPVGVGYCAVQRFLWHNADWLD